MTKQLIPDTHIIMRSTQEVYNICADFFRSSGIKFFVFNRTYKTDYTTDHNKGFFLSSHTEWVKHFITYDYLHRISMIGVNVVGEFSGYKILLCDLFKDNLMLKNLRDYFAIDHGILVCKQYPGYCEWYTFAADKDDPQTIHYYLNNFEELIQFILYFKKRAAKIISAAEKADFPVPKPTAENKLIQNIAASEVIFGKKEKWMDSNKCFIEIDNMLYELSKREAECLAYIKQGYSAKLTAKALDISPRTVETHLKNIYNKVGCSSKTQLLMLLK